MQVLQFLLARFSEPSSYAGIGAILALAGVHFSDSDLGQIAQFLAAGCGLAALLLKERGIIQMIALAVLVGGALSACAPLVAAGASTGAVGSGLVIANQVASTVDTTIQTACTEYEKGRAAANAVVGTGLVPSPMRLARSASSRNTETPPARHRPRAMCCRPPSGSASWSD